MYVCMCITDGVCMILSVYVCVCMGCLCDSVFVCVRVR